MTHRLLITRDNAVLASNWWDELGLEERKAYLERHPNSKYKTRLYGGGLAKHGRPAKAEEIDRVAKKLRKTKSTKAGERAQARIGGLKGKELEEEIDATDEERSVLDKFFNGGEDYDGPTLKSVLGGVLKRLLIAAAFTAIAFTVVAVGGGAVIYMLHDGQIINYMIESLMSGAIASLAAVDQRTGLEKLRDHLVDVLQNPPPGLLKHGVVVGAA
jgi:hypothetical protein